MQLFNNSRTVRLINTLLMIIAFFHFIMYLWVVYHRINYPFDLEWIEGNVFIHVKRIVEGKPIYIKPNIEFASLLYSPFYFYISAFVSKLTGVGVFAPRLVSFLASIISAILIFLIVRHETKKWDLAFLASCFFIATFKISGSWFDLARTDSLFLALWLVFIYINLFDYSNTKAIIAGIFLAFAYLTKQTAFVASLPLIIYLFWYRWRYALIVNIISVSIIVSVTLLFDNKTDGWFSFYTFDSLSMQTLWLFDKIINFWQVDLIAVLPIALLFVVVFFVMYKQHKNRERIIFWMFVFIGALGVSYITRIKMGGHNNVLFPLYAILIILFIFGLDTTYELLKMYIQAPFIKTLFIIIQISVIFQLIILIYNPFDQIPTVTDYETGQRIVDLISSVEGEVLVTNLGYISTYAGKRTYAHDGSVGDLLRSDKSDIMWAEYDRTISQQYFDMIIFNSHSNPCCANILQYYDYVGDIQYTDENKDRRDFLTVAGVPTRPIAVFKAKRLR